MIVLRLVACLLVDVGGEQIATLQLRLFSCRASGASLRSLRGGFNRQSVEVLAYAET